MGWGGKRKGSGRKPLTEAEKAARKEAKQAATVLQHPSSSGLPTTNGLPEVEEFDAPDDLTAEERAVWMKQAPFAFANGTLVRATALSFERYCKSVVLERNEAKSSGVGGANHRGLLRYLRDLEQDFKLTANGKPLAAPKPDEATQPASKLGRFRA